VATVTISGTGRSGNSIFQGVGVALARQFPPDKLHLVGRPESRVPSAPVDLARLGGDAGRSAPRNHRIATDRDDSEGNPTAFARTFSML